LAYILLLLCVAFFGISIKLSGGVQLIDVMLSVFFISVFWTVRARYHSYLLIVVFYFILVVSNVTGLLSGRNFYFEQVIFFYKYFVVLFLPLAIISVVNTKERLFFLYRFLYLVFLVLSFWSIARVGLISSGYFRGSLRSGFPTVPLDGYSTDAHLFSCYLIMMFVAYMEFYRRFYRHTFLKTSVIVTFSLLACFGTGSRTFLLILFLYALFFSVRWIATSLSSSYRYLGLISLISLLSIFFIVIGVFSHSIDVLVVRIPEVDFYLSRALDFNLAQDDSSLSRISKLFIAIDSVSEVGYALGNGPIFSDLVWYDGIISVLIAHGGLTLLFYSFLLIVFIICSVGSAFLRSGFYNQLISFNVIFSLYCSANIVTEYVLVTRNALPIIIFLSLYYVHFSRFKGVGIRHEYDRLNSARG